MNSNNTTQPRLGLLSLSCLVVANMIGAGVYTSSGFALGSLGSRGWVMAAWMIAGGIALLGAICYGGLVKQITESGGEALFLSRLVHPLAGFMAGWISLTAGFSGAIAFSAITFESYLTQSYFSESSWLKSLPDGSIAVALILVFGVIHWVGFSTGTRFQNALVIFKLMLLVLFIGLGAYTVFEPGNETNLRFTSLAADAVMGRDDLGNFSISALATSVMWISLSYAGYNAAVYVAGASRNGTVVARSMGIATVLVMLIYLALNLVVLYSVPMVALANQKEVFSIAAAAIGVPWLTTLVVGTILLSLATSVSAMLQAGPHVYAQMARDGLLPQRVAETGSSTNPIPRFALALQVVLACVLTVFGNLQQLLDYLTFLLLLSSAATVACLLLPSLRGTPGSRPVALWPWTPVVFVAVSLGIAFLSLRYRWDTDPKGLGMALVVLPLGLLIYPLLSHRGKALDH